jgi:hypothetical protein
LRFNGWKNPEKEKAQFEGPRGDVDDHFSLLCRSSIYTIRNLPEVDNNGKYHIHFSKKE